VPRQRVLVQDRPLRRWGKVGDYEAILIPGGAWNPLTL
jgi:hypothetical protein